MFKEWRKPSQKRWLPQQQRQRQLRHSMLDRCNGFQTASVSNGSLTVFVVYFAGRRWLCLSTTRSVWRMRLMIPLRRCCTFIPAGSRTHRRWHYVVSWWAPRTSSRIASSSRAYSRCRMANSCSRSLVASRWWVWKSRRFSVLVTKRGFLSGCGHRSQHSGSIAGTSCESAELLAEVLSSGSTVAARSVCTAHPRTQSESLREIISHIRDISAHAAAQRQHIPECAQAAHAQGNEVCSPSSLYSNSL